MGINLNLRVVLLGLGALFVLAILLDGLRRKYRRRQRIQTDEKLPADYPEAQAEDFDIHYHPAKTTQPSVGDVDLVEIDSVVQSKPVVSEPINEAPAASQQRFVPAQVLTVYVQAEVGKPYIGYELLQAILSSGLRFGQMNIFHRYQELSGQGPILFSLASANEPGIFDIHNMGASSCTGLSLFSKISGDKSGTIKNLDLMLETANQLAVDLGGNLLDHNGHDFSIDTYKQYRQMIDLATQKLETEAVQPLGV